MNVNSPIYAWFAPFLTGFKLTYVSATALTLSAGIATDSSDNVGSNVIKLDADVTLSFAKNGYNGLDRGTVAANTFYKVYAIGSSAHPAVSANDQVVVENKYPAGGLLSTSATPSLPFGYDMYRYVGTVLTDGSGNLLKFAQTGADLDRTMWYDTAIVVLTGGNAASNTLIGLSAAVPAPYLKVMVEVSFIPSTASGKVWLQPYGSTANGGYAIITGQSSGVEVTENGDLPCSSNSGAPAIQYRVLGSSVLLSVNGYVDEL